MERKQSRDISSFPMQVGDLVVDYPDIESSIAKIGKNQTNFPKKQSDLDCHFKKGDQVTLEISRGSPAYLPWEKML